MFPFGNKKKDHAGINDPSSIRQHETSSTSRKPTTTTSSQAGKPSDDSTTAKNRLLGAFGGGKKREKSPSPQQLMTNTGVGGIKSYQQKNGGAGEFTRPLPPAKPPRIASSIPAAEECDNFHPLKTFNIPGLRLPVLKAANGTEDRVLTFNRQPNGEYGFTLRRAVAVDRLSDGSVTQRNVIMVDYKKSSTTNDVSTTSSVPMLQPGDQLLAINGEMVERLSREEIVAVIRRIDAEEIYLKVKQLNSNTERKVSFKRQPNGEFGFLLRRSQVVDVYSDGTEQRREIVLAEPMKQQLVKAPSLEKRTAADGDQPANNDNTASLPRVQLIAVNGRPIDNLSRDQLISFINDQGGNVIQLTVRPAPVLSSPTPAPVAEGSTTNGGDNGATSDPSADARTICQQQSSADALDNERRIWLVHRHGYAAGVLITGGSTNDDGGGKIRLRLTEVPGDVVIEVDATDVEKANPASLDRADDVAKIVYLNESSVIHLLRTRYVASLIHTYAGSFSMLVLKPQIPLSIYSEQVIHGIKGCRRRDTPPHIYAVAQRTYRSMIANRRSQSILFTGRSGSGKTTQLRHFLHFLCRCSGTANKVLGPDKASAIFTVLDAFGSCSTSASNNSDSSRFVTFLTVDFDHVGEISSGLLQCLILEYNRVVRANEGGGGSNFHVFSYLWYGTAAADPELRKQLLLDELEDGGASSTATLLLGQRDTSRDDTTEYYRNKFSRLCSSFETLGVSDAERRVVYSVLSAIFHLTSAGATKGVPSSKSTFLKPIHAQKAAQLLGVSLEDLQKTIFISTNAQQNQEHPERDAQHLQQNEKRSSISNAVGRNFRRVTPFKAGGVGLNDHKLSITDRPGDGVEALEAFIIGLYRETFNVVVSLINRSLSSNYRAVTSITLVDYPGYQSGPADRKAGFNEFCFNYVNERIHAFYHDTIFQNQMEIYRQEKVNVDFQAPSMSVNALVDLIDKPMQHHIVKSTNLEARSQEKRGLLWLLDEESIFPGARDDSFVERVFVHYAEAGHSKYLMKSRTHHNHFILRHAFGTFPVTYNATGWLRLAQENPVTRQALPLLQESANSAISTLYLMLRAGGIVAGQSAANLTSSSGGDNASLRRTTAVFKTLTAPQALKRKSYCALLKLQMDYLIQNLRSAGRVYFVHCIDPLVVDSSAVNNSSSGNIDDGGDIIHNKTTALSNNNNNSHSLLPAAINVPSLRSQLRALQITDSVRFDKLGYNERMLFGEFRRRFHCLAVSASPPNHNDKNVIGGDKLHRLLDDRGEVSRLLTEVFEADKSQAVLGVSCVFMQTNFLAQLEDKRDQELTSIVAQFQARCRTYLARERLKKRRVQDTAVRCVQKNINKYLAVQAWPWWRLYTRILPLLSIRKTEEEMKADRDELDALRAKCKKLEKQYGELRLHCDRLEARLEESRSEASDERVTTTQLNEALEEENKMRIRAEKELTELKNAYAVAQKQLEKLELESMESKKAKLLLAAEENSVDDDEEESVEQLKEKLKEARMQAEVERKRYENEKREEQDHHRRMKQKLEKKVAELQKDVENSQEQCSASRRMVEKMRDEAHDLRLHLQQVTSRNTDLEKRQRKFDSELQAVKCETEVERAQKERLLKEFQTSTSECLRLEEELRKAREEISEWQQKCDAAEENVRAINDGQTSSGVNEQQSRLQKQALERKCAEQEAELDDMSGELQQLQQRVTRLEMQNEKLRMENAKDAERREEEFDELRAQNQRRIRMLEEQIDDERHQKEITQRKYKELELRLHEVEEAPESARQNASEVTSLKRHLKKVKALLKDSQLVIEQYERNDSHKSLTKQLKNQLDDAIAAKLSAVKSKQNLESELEDVRAALSAAESAKSAAEDRCMRILKEKTTLENRLTDMNQEVQDLLKKYKAQVQQSSVDHITLNDQIQRIGDLDRENESLKDKVNELSSQLERMNASSVDKHKLQLAETKLRQLESKVELESAARTRAEAQCTKAQEQLEHLKEQVQNVQAAKDRETESMKRLQNQYTHQQDTLRALQKREADLAQRQRDLEATVERLEEENTQSGNKLKTALRRVDELQAALRDDVENDDTYVEDAEDDDANSDDDDDDYSSEENEDAGSGSGRLLPAAAAAGGGRSSVVPASPRPSSGASTHISC